MNFVRLMILGVLLSVLSTSVFAADRLTIYTVNYPLAYFAERIGGEQVKVVFPAPVDIDPAYWMPDQKTIASYQKADLILLNGANYAKWVGKVSLPCGKMIDTSRKFKDRYIVTKDVSTHSHGAEGAHAHESLAFTTWLDYSLAAEQARAVADALGRKRPALMKEFSRNFESLRKDLMVLDSEIMRIVSTAPGMPLIASHPVYDYLARRYDLNLKSLHWEPDEVPGHGQLAELRKLLETHPAIMMIWEGEPLQESLDKLSSMGIKGLVFSPCANAPDEGDFLTVMKDNLKGLQNAYVNQTSQ